MKLDPMTIACIVIVTPSLLLYLMMILGSLVKGSDACRPSDPVKTTETCRICGCVVNSRAFFNGVCVECRLVQSRTAEPRKKPSGEVVQAIPASVRDWDEEDGETIFVKPTDGKGSGNE